MASVDIQTTCLGALVLYWGPIFLRKRIVVECERLRRDSGNEAVTARTQHAMRQEALKPSHSNFPAVCFQAWFVAIKPDMAAKLDQIDGQPIKLSEFFRDLAHEKHALADCAAKPLAKCEWRGYIWM